MRHATRFRIAQQTGLTVFLSRAIQPVCRKNNRRQRVRGRKRRWCALKGFKWRNNPSGAGLD
ncbi:hypothetical protein X777_13098 [Ooceraea biroi]|uniref:Uncharacterized protein n=1 Tax=Ooceraea biroi TaxID=2015173 RepID=A0A026WYQ1_OOCBI|nr:hypothetical protein X777_13098 [Ooceraea biroi]